MRSRLTFKHSRIAENWRICGTIPTNLTSTGYNLTYGLGVPALAGVLDAAAAAAAAFAFFTCVSFSCFSFSSADLISRILVLEASIYCSISVIFSAVKPG